MRPACSRTCSSAATGDTLVVKVVENPLVNRVAFEGNHKLTDDQLRPEMQLKPRAVFTPSLAEADRQHILDLYAKRGYYDARVDPQIIRLDQNRVDVVFQISDGPSTLISKIAFVGNHAFSEEPADGSDQQPRGALVAVPVHLRRIRSGAAELRQGTAAPVLPEERLHRLRGDRRHGGAVARPHRRSSSPLPSARASAIASARSPSPRSSATSTATTCAATCRSRKATGMTATRSAAPPMRWRRTSTPAAMRSSTSSRASTRDREKHTVDLTFDVGEGPRVYVERIDIVGNTRTEDKVIRREFRLAGGRRVQCRGGTPHAPAAAGSRLLQQRRHRPPRRVRRRTRRSSPPRSAKRRPAN